jgi:hypothetical protein
MARYQSLNDAQKHALDEAEAALTKAYDDARAKLRAAGLGPRDQSEGGSFRCLRCDCEGFQRAPGGGLRCARPGCGHSFFRHDVF